MASPSSVSRQLSDACSSGAELSDATSAASTASECSSSSPESLSGQKRRLGARDAPSPKREARKPRTRWYALQKEERALLQKEATYLAAHLDFLQHMPENRSAARMLARLQRENETLRRAMHSQQFALAGAQSALTSYSINQHTPFERRIHLGRDARERRETLLAMKDSALHDAELYLRERSRFLDPTQKYTSLEKSTTPSGDFLVQTFEMMPLPGVPTVKYAYDALRFYFFNLDIGLAESSGEFVVREGKDEPANQDVTNQRIVRTTDSGIQVESNCVMSCKYSASDEEGSAGSEFAVITMDSVAEDALFPYRSATRLRQDITAAITLRAFPRKVTRIVDEDEQKRGSSEQQARADGAASLAPEEFDVVICRSYTSKLHHSESLVIPPEVIDSTVVTADMCSREILRTIYEAVCSLAKSL